MFNLILGFLPGLIWLAIFLYRDRRKPEPSHMIAKIFLFGMLITPLAIIAELALKPIEIFPVLYIFLVIAPVEELVKYLVFKLKILKNKFYDEPIDAMIYMITIALGFASVENIILILQNSASTFNLLVLRFLSATLLHALAAGIIGYYIAKKKTSIGLVIAIAFHGVYDYFALLHTDKALQLLGPLLIFMFILVSVYFKKVRKIK